MLREAMDPAAIDWASAEDDPTNDRVMLAIQYAVALIAVLAAGLLSTVH